MKNKQKSKVKPMRKYGKAVGVGVVIAGLLATTIYFGVNQKSEMDKYAEGMFPVLLDDYFMNMCAVYRERINATNYYACKVTNYWLQDGNFYVDFDRIEVDAVTAQMTTGIPVKEQAIFYHGSKGAEIQWHYGE